MAENNQDKENNGEDKKGDQTKPAPPVDEIVETSHTITLNGVEIPYTTTTGRIVLKEEKDKEGHQPKGQVFFIAYTRDDVEDRHRRPITFSFNGGPGSSSVWLHLGLLGPRRVPVSGDDTPLPPPYALVDNEFSLLDHTDLVFIDPVGTGYSRAVEGEKNEQFWSFTKDIESVGEFIRLYTSRYRRWSSPKFLIGESYGTTRAAGLAGFLQERHGMFLNGIMLVSSILNFQTARFEPGNDLPYVLFLPAYAATAWYHGRVADAYRQMPLPDFLAEVGSFAEGDYLLALMKGDRLPADRRADILQLLSAFTGLSQNYLEQTNLRINIHRFVKELLRDEGKTIGRFDSRIVGYDRDEAGERHEHDPSYDIVQGQYTACFNDYVRSELKFESDLPYEIISMNVFPNWKYDKQQNQYANTAETLRGAMTANPYLKVLVANGYYDLATPFFATEYTFHSMGLKPHLRQNVTMTYYPAGHMMYLHRPSRERLAVDLRAFITSALPE